MLWNYNYIYKKWSPLQKVFQCYLFTFMVNKKGDSFCGYEFDILYTYAINLWSPFFILTIKEIWKCYDLLWIWDIKCMVRTLLLNQVFQMEKLFAILATLYYLNAIFIFSWIISLSDFIFPCLFVGIMLSSSLNVNISFNYMLLVFISRQRHFNAYLKIDSQVSYQKLIVYHLS